MRRASDALTRAPQGIGRDVHAAGDAVTARISGSSLRVANNAFGVLVTDSRGQPLPLPYGTGTTVAGTSSGIVTQVSVPAIGSAHARRAPI